MPRSTRRLSVDQLESRATPSESTFTSSHHLSPQTDARPMLEAREHALRIVADDGDSLTGRHEVARAAEAYPERLRVWDEVRVEPTQFYAGIAGEADAFAGVVRVDPEVAGPGTYWIALHELAHVVAARVTGHVDGGDEFVSLFNAVPSVWTGVAAPGEALAWTIAAWAAGPIDGITPPAEFLAFVSQRLGVPSD